MVADANIGSVFLPPSGQAQTIVLVFFQRGGIKYADHIVGYSYRVDLLALLTSSMPVQRIDIL